MKTELDINRHVCKLFVDNAGGILLVSHDNNYAHSYTDAGCSSNFYADMLDNITTDICRLLDDADDYAGWDGNLIDDLNDFKAVVGDYDDYYYVLDAVDALAYIAALKHKNLENQ